MTLSPADLRKIKDTFNAYAKNHPTPDAPSIASDKVYSVRELAQAIENETGLGKTFIKVIERFVEDGETMDNILEQFTPKPPRP